MKYLRSIILLGLALLPCIAAAQIAPVPVAPQQEHEVQQPKLVPALGWDVAKQGGFCTAVVADPQNNVWVGTEGNGLWCYDVRKKTWTQFTTKDGLGDDCIYALTVDKQGRIWAGHLNHGVSVYNGDKWKNYGFVDGPLGSRVFAIATCPTDGDVWIATEIGVARYSLADDTWDYFTTASGLPSNQIQAVAFDEKGNIYLGTQCDGVAMADAKDKYAKWVTAPGLPDMPNASTGVGLASGMINDITMVVPPQNAMAMGEAERLIVATPLGISTSSDYGDHFNFIRGEDWQDNFKGLFQQADAQKANNNNNQPGGAGGVINAGGGRVIINGPNTVIVGGNGNINVQVANLQQRFLLREDWAVCVHQEKETGRLWVGYRTKGLEIRNFGITPSVSYDMTGIDTMEVRSIWTGAKTPAYIACYDAKNGGLKTPSDSTVDLSPGDRPPHDLPDLPSPAKPPSADDIAPLAKRLDFFKNDLEAGDAVYVGDDWNTGGDWIGHYGSAYAMLYINEGALSGHGMNPGGAVTVPYESEPGCSSSIEMGPHRKEDDKVMYHSANRSTDNPRVLYGPTIGRRSEGEVNDRSFDKDSYPYTWEGPDLWVNVEIPKGIHSLSLYFQNYDGQEGGDNKYRDYEIEILHPADTQALALKGPVLAHARVTDFLGGVYKQFALSGPAKYVVHIKRNRSYVTKLLGLFIDRAVEDPSIPQKPLPGFDDVKYTTPEVPGDFDPGNNAALSAASDLWDGIVGTVDKRGAIPLEQTLGIWAYRAAFAAKAPDSLLASWRWEMCLWTQADRDEFDKATADAYKAYSAKKTAPTQEEKPSDTAK